MHHLVTSKYNWVVQFNPMVLVTNLISRQRARKNFLQRNSIPEAKPVEYLTIRERYYALVDPGHIPHDMPGMRYFIEFMNFSYSIGAYMFPGTDYLNHGFFEDFHKGRRGFKEYFKNPCEATLWIATRNSFTYWLHHSRERLGTKSSDFIFINFFEKMANEGVRRALLEPGFNSDKIVSGDLLYMIDYWGKAVYRVWKNKPLFTDEEWTAIPEKYKKLISPDLVLTMDLAAPRLIEDSEEALENEVKKLAC